MHTRERKKIQFSRNCPRTVRAIAMVNNGRHNWTMQVTHGRKKETNDKVARKRSAYVCYKPSLKRDIFEISVSKIAAGYSL